MNDQLVTHRWKAYRAESLSSLFTNTHNKDIQLKLANVWRFIALALSHGLSLLPDHDGENGCLKVSLTTNRLWSSLVFVCTCASVLKLCHAAVGMIRAWRWEEKPRQREDIKAIQSLSSQNKNKQYSNKTTHVYPCASRWAFSLQKLMRASWVMSCCGAKARRGDINI